MKRSLWVPSTHSRNDRRPHKIKNVLIVIEFGDVFPEELLGLPPQREVEFSIEILSGISPISIPPYKMAPI